MDNFNQPDPNATAYQALGTPAQPGPNFAAGHPNVAAGSVATTGEARRGRSRFLGVLGAVVLAAVAGVVGYTAAGAMFGEDATDVRTTSVTPGDASDDADAETPIDGTDGAEDGAADDAAVDGSNGTEGETPVPGAAMTVEQANASVVRIEATGEFADPEFGFIEGVGSGSGFIINSDGLAVTNNHVVAGAAFIEVFVPGEDRPRNARILATSECSDLAVIDIDGGGYPAVALNMTSPTIGTDVYAAGYPLGDPEFTLTKGIVSKADTRGDTPLSSVDGVLEHDAKINPGNSGGPLFDQFGQVVGVNYQGNPSTEQSFAITAADAIDIIDRLSLGTSVDSIGINGQIVDLGDRYGLFISSVETGSMADQAGATSGDVILEIEDVAVSTDGTMGAYCDVLRTNGTDVPLNITVLRPATDQLLFGTLNGTSLDVGFDSGEMMSQAGMSTVGSDTVHEAGDYQLVVDDSGAVAVEVPAAWTEIATGAIGSSENIPNVSASTDLDSYENDWVVGGLQLTAFDTSVYTFDEIWNARNALMDECGTVETAEEVTLGRYDGVIRVGHDCGPQATASLLLFQVNAPGSDNFASGIIQVVTQDDVAAVERALATFVIS